MDYRYGSHTVYNIEYHFVWVTKYRYKVLTGDVALRVREMVRQTCELFGIKILLALHVFAVAFLITKPVNPRRSRMMTGTIISGLIILAISAYLRRIF